MIDKAHKDKKCYKFDRSFRIEVYMSETRNYKMEKKNFEKEGVELFMPVENFSENQKKLLDMAKTLPIQKRKISL